MEYAVVALLFSGFIPVCQVPKNAMGHESGTLHPYPLSTNQYPRCDKLKYQHALVSGGSNCLKVYGSHWEEIPFWNLPSGDPYRLWQPDILHLQNLTNMKSMMECVNG
jgi:hypothetical protein